MEEILKWIKEEADYEQLQQIMAAVSARFRTSFPDWEVLYMAAHAISAEEQAQFHKDATDLLNRYNR